VSLFNFCNKGLNFTEFGAHIMPLKGIFSLVCLTVYNQKQHKKGTSSFGGCDTSATSPGTPVWRSKNENLFDVKQQHGSCTKFLG
jgi:hypothetical protein